MLTSEFADIAEQPVIIKKTACYCQVFLEVVWKRAITELKIGHFVCYRLSLLFYFTFLYYFASALRLESLIDINVLIFNLLFAHRITDVIFLLLI